MPLTPESNQSLSPSTVDKMIQNQLTIFRYETVPIRKETNQTAPFSPPQALNPKSKADPTTMKPAQEK